MERQPRTVIFGEQVRDSILKGVTIAYKAVATTLGSKGRNVSIEKNWGAPLIIHDGVTVARELILDDQYANQAAQQVIHVAQNTNAAAGDGTTTATILTYALTTEGMKQIAAKINPQILRRGIDKAIELVIAQLKRSAQPVSSFDEMKQVASVSAASPELGDIIATATQKVGEHGAVTVQEGMSAEIEVEYKEGMEFQQGLISNYLMTDPERMEAVLEGTGESMPFVVIINEKLTNDAIVNKILKPIFTYDNNSRVLIIANDFEAEAKGTLILNKLKLNRAYAGVKAPEYGEHRSNMLHDIAMVTGAKVIGGSTGIAMSSVTEDLSAFGRAERIVVNRDQTIIIGGKGNKKEIESHVKGIRSLIKNARTEFEKDKAQARLAKLVGGVAVIQVGAHTEAEMREKKERVYDAVNATRAAIEEGIVAGGGVGLLSAGAVALSDEKLKRYSERDQIGMRIVREALEYPIRKLVKNAGVENSGYILETIKRSNKKHYGYNVDTEQFENLVESGIIDPVKVSIAALQNAGSAAVMLLTTECMIAFKREKSHTENNDMEGVGSFE